MQSFDACIQIGNRLHTNGPIQVSVLDIWSKTKTMGTRNLKKKITCEVNL